MADAGSAGTVAAGNPGKQSAGGIAGMLGFKTAKAQGPNAAAYDDERNRAHAQGDQYYGLSQDYRQDAPTIANQFQGESRAGIGGNIGAQQSLANALMQNNGEASKAQFQSGLDQSIAAQMAAANSANGGAVAQAGAVRNAAALGAQQRAAGAATAAQLGAQERAQALGQAAGVYGNIGNQLQNQYGLEQNSAIAQGQLDSQNQAQQNAMRLGYGQLGQQAGAQGLNALNSYTSGNMAAQGLSAGLQGQSIATTNQLIGTGANLGGTLLTAPGGPLGAGPTPKAAAGGAIGPASNSIADLYGKHIAAQVAPRKAPTATLADALVGIEELKKRLETRAEGGMIDIGSGAGGISNQDVLLASTGRTGNAMTPVGGGGVVGGTGVPGGAGGGGGQGGLAKFLGAVGRVF